MIDETLLTAEQARNLSDKSFMEHVKDVLYLVKKYAKDGKNTLIMNTDFWSMEAAKNTTKYQLSVGLLKQLGYKVEYFSDPFKSYGYTLISW